MKKEILISYNFNNKKYHKNKLHESGISWCNSWIDAYDFNHNYFNKGLI